MSSPDGPKLVVDNDGAQSDADRSARRSNRRRCSASVTFTPTAEGRATHHQRAHPPPAYDDDTDVIEESFEGGIGRNSAIGGSFRTAPSRGQSAGSTGGAPAALEVGFSGIGQGGVSPTPRAAGHMAAIAAVQTPSRSPSTVIANGVRLARKTFFESIGRDGNQRPIAAGQLLCPALASVAGALCYLSHFRHEEEEEDDDDEEPVPMGDGGSPGQSHTHKSPILQSTPAAAAPEPIRVVATPVPLAVTIDDVATATRLPLNALHSSTNMTLPEAQAIAAEMISGDSRFAGLAIDQVTFDAKLKGVDVFDANTDVDSAARAVAVSVSELRHAVAAGQHHRAATITFFDRAVVEDAWAVDDADGSRDSAPQCADDSRPTLPKSAVAGGSCTEESFMPQLLAKNTTDYHTTADKATHTHVRPVECGIIVGVTRQDAIEVAIPTPNPAGAGKPADGYHFRVVEVPIAALHAAMAARHRRTGRPNGTLTIRVRRHPGTAGGSFRAVPGASQAAVVASAAGSGNAACRRRQRTHTPSSQGTPEDHPITALAPEDGEELMETSMAAAASEQALQQRRAVSPRGRATRPLLYPQLAAQYRPVCPTTTRSLFLLHNSTDAASHLTALAFGFAVLRSTAANGVDCNDIVTALHLGVDHVTPSPLPLANVAAMARTYVKTPAFAAAAPKAPAVGALAVPLLQAVHRAGAGAAMSVSDLARALGALRAANHSVNVPTAVMLCAFSPSVAHGAVGVGHPKAGDVHWGLVGQYDVENEIVTIVDTHPRKYGAAWSVPVAQLHAAMLGQGYLVLFNEGTGAAACPKEVLLDLQGPQSAYTAHFGDVVDSFVFDQLPPAADPIAGGIPLSLGAVALDAVASTATARHSFSAMLQHAPCAVSFLLTEHLAVFDFARVLNRYCTDTKADAHASPHLLHAACTVERDAFAAAVEKSVAKGSTTRVLVSAALRLVKHNTRLMRWSACDYLLVTGVTTGPNGTKWVTVMDSNPEPSLRAWRLPLCVLTDAAALPESRDAAPVGYIVVSRGGCPTSPARSLGANATVLVDPARIDRFAMPTLHPFHSPRLPAVTGAAAALTSLGARCCAEELVYAAIANSEEDVKGEEDADRLRPTALVAAARPSLPAALLVCLVTRAAAELNMKGISVTDASAQSLQATLSATSTVTRVLLTHDGSVRDKQNCAVSASGGCAIVVATNGETAHMSEMCTASAPESWAARIADLDAARSAGKVSVVLIGSK